MLTLLHHRHGTTAFRTTAKTRQWTGHLRQRAASVGRTRSWVLQDMSAHRFAVPLPRFVGGRGAASPRDQGRKRASVIHWRGDKQTASRKIQPNPGGASPLVGGTDVLESGDGAHVSAIRLSGRREWWQLQAHSAPREPRPVPFSPASTSPCCLPRPTTLRPQLPVRVPATSRSSSSVSLRAPLVPSRQEPEGRLRSAGSRTGWTLPGAGGLLRGCPE